eukprot:10000693-Alexandrium_andersonii.AAC.1
MCIRDSARAHARTRAHAHARAFAAARRGSHSTRESESSRLGGSEEDEDIANPRGSQGTSAQAGLAAGGRRPHRHSP